MLATPFTDAEYRTAQGVTDAQSVRIGKYWQPDTGRALLRPPPPSPIVIQCPDHLLIIPSASMILTIYSKPGCVQCTATTRALDARGVPYELVDVTTDGEAMAFIASLGYRQAPVVVVDAGEHWSGFRPDRLVTLSAGEETIR